MGLVFRATANDSSERLAIKFLDSLPSKDDEARTARFLREGQVALAVDHPGAARFVTSGRDELGRMYLVFEFVEGTELRRVLRRDGRMSFEEARSIALQIADVLGFAHDRGVIHRDVKPENIRIRREANETSVKVLDFGIAKLLDDNGVRLTATGALAGTPRYMAPEQITDAGIDARTDVYALGLLLFEMLTGAPAYSGHNLSNILMSQVKLPVPSIASVLEGFESPAIDAFLAKACAKNPEARFQSMEAFSRSLSSLKVKTWPKPEPLAPRAEPVSNSDPTFAPPGATIGERSTASLSDQSTDVMIRPSGILTASPGDTLSSTSPSNRAAAHGLSQNLTVRSQPSHRELIVRGAVIALFSAAIVLFWLWYIRT
jgi:serine/threonine protein kinase